MERLTLYLKESYNELVHNVSWPTSAQLQESTLVVIVTAVLLALFIFLMDGACNAIIGSLYGTF